MASTRSSLRKPGATRSPVAQAVVQFIARFNAGGSPYRFWPGGANGTLMNVETFGGAFGGTPASVCANFAQLPDHELAVAGNGALPRAERRTVRIRCSR